MIAIVRSILTMLLMCIVMPAGAQLQGTISAGKAPESQVEVKPLNKAWNVEVTNKRFLAAVNDFKERLQPVKEKLAAKPSKQEAYNAISLPYSSFLDRLREVELTGMVGYVDAIEKSIAASSRSFLVDDEAFATECLSKTEKLLSVLERRKTDIFIEPLAFAILSPAELQLSPYVAPQSPPSPGPGPFFIVQNLDDQSVITNSHFPRFPRGTYTYIVKLSNGDMGRGVLNLVDGDATRIYCEDLASKAHCQTN